MKYHTINELDTALEKVVRRTVESYYTDWKNYDRPKYMGFKGSQDRADKDLIAIVRTCGTYLIRTADIYKSDWTTTIFEYYQTQESATYYNINIDSLRLEKIDPAQYGKELKKAA